MAITKVTRGYNIKMKGIQLFSFPYRDDLAIMSHISDIVTENLMYRYNILSPTHAVNNFVPVHRFTGTGVYSLVLSVSIKFM